MTASKRASTRESISLAFELLKRIPRSYKVTASELRAQLEEIGISRDIRTIQRNLEMLCEHFDIEKDDRSKPYGYSWISGSKGFSLPSLSPHESLLLHLAEDYLKLLLPGSMMASLDSLFHQAKYNLHPAQEYHKEREWLKKVRVVSETQPLIAPKIDNTVFKRISEALYHNRWVTLLYQNSRKEEKKAEVMPLGLAKQGNRLYLVCRYKGYSNERTLAVHRIREVLLSTFTFTRPKDFELEQYDADGRFGFGEGRKCSIKFCISKAAGYHLLETPLSKNQTVIEHIDHYQITAEVIESMQLSRWLNSFGEELWSVRFI